MKFKSICLILMLFVILISFNSVAAIEDNNTASLTVSDQELKVGNTINVDIDDNPNQMSNPTIQNAINRANSGDTIIINGDYFQHCHFIVDKKLTIKSSNTTTLTPCTSTRDSGHVGIFYLTSQASGSIIEGFVLGHDNKYGESEGYGVLISGASDVIIKNCTINTNSLADSIRLENTKNTLIDNVDVFNSVNGINIKNSESVSVTNSIIRNCENGINILSSSNSYIYENNIYSNLVGVNVGNLTSNTTITSNNITNNKNSGVNLSSSAYVNILSNYISNNKFGVYVNCNIVKIVINGNFFNKNTLYEVYDDYRTRNLARDGGEKLQEINNNFMIGHNERPVYNSVFKYMGENGGSYTYDEEKDVYINVGSGLGDYEELKDAVFLGYVFEINEYVGCPVIYYTYGPKPWSQSGNYELQLSNITQIKKGIYSVSIVDENGNIAHDLSSVPVTFYVNKADSSSTPKEGDFYKTVMMKNGTATVRFYMDEFNKSGNIITAVLPTPGAKIDEKVSRTLAIDDADIPGIPLNTTIITSNMDTFPNSNEELTVTLTDINGKVIADEELIFTLNSKTYTSITDINGNAKIRISEASEGTFKVEVHYDGDDVEYLQSTAFLIVSVKKQTTKLISSNMNMIPKKSDYYSVILKDGNGNVIANQKVIFKVNGNSYVKTTDSKGVCKVKLTFTKNKKSYKIKITYNGNNKFKSISKTNKITVKYSSKKVKLSTPNVSIPPKTSTLYKISLNDENSKGISKQKVVVKINGKKYIKTTNSKGQINIKLKFSKLKSYKVSASYSGNKIYKKASSKGIIKVTKTATVISAPDVSMFPNEAKSFSITLKTNTGKALSKQKLTVKVDGKTYSKTTNNNGQVILNFNFGNENKYSVDIIYKGTSIYKSSKTTSYVNVEKITTSILSYDRTYSKNLDKNFSVILKDASGNLLSDENILFNYNNKSIMKTTDNNGEAGFNLDINSSGAYNIEVKYGGSEKYKTSQITNHITISNQTDTIFIDSSLENLQIQSIINQADDFNSIEFLGNSYSDISLTINKSLNIYSKNSSVLNGKLNSPIFQILSSNANISNFSLISNSDDAIRLVNAKNAAIFENNISNKLEESKLNEYMQSTISLPGYGISIINSTDISISKNNISFFESAVYSEYSSKLVISNNTLFKSNYGIKYGYGVSNTEIFNNEIVNNIGLYIMSVPEGPRGYGIFLNNSAVNVSINKNHIFSNHIGISLDANYSTGIVITQNTFTDNVLEGIRFNAGYDLAENAIKPLVTDNAIYRNAKGPSMMILGELSANPEGIYGNGLYNDSFKLQLDANWYGTNQITTWDNDTGNVGYGTMCPRINTSEIKFNNISFDGENYVVEFYKNGILASNLPVFDLFVTLNREVELNFNVVNGVGKFNFKSDDFKSDNNTFEITVSSLINSTSRVPKIIYTYDVE